MKKKGFALGVALVLLLSLVACIRYETTLTFHADGMVDARILAAVSESVSSTSGAEIGNGLTEEEIAAYREKGITYEEYTDKDAGYVGYTLTRKGVDLKEIENSAEASGLESAIDIKFIQVDGKHVVIDYEPLSESDYNEAGSYFSMLESYNGYMRFNLELPSKPTNHNATTVSSDQKVLTWDLTKMKPGDKIHAEFDLTPGTSILAWLLPVIGAIVLIAIIVIVILLKKKKSSTVQTAEAQPVIAKEPEETEPAEQPVATEPAEEVPEKADYLEAEAKFEEFEAENREAAEGCEAEAGNEE